MPLWISPFVEEEGWADGAGATPKSPHCAGAGGDGVDNKGQVGVAGMKLKPQVQEEDLEEDPFRQSLEHNEEAQIRTVVRAKTGCPGAGQAGTSTGGEMRMPMSAGVFRTTANSLWQILILAWVQWMVTALDLDIEKLGLQVVLVMGFNFNRSSSSRGCSQAHKT